MPVNTYCSYCRVYGHTIQECHSTRPASPQPWSHPTFQPPPMTEERLRQIIREELARLTTPTKGD
jgi:hypothetical protein